MSVPRLRAGVVKSFRKRVFSPDGCYSFLFFVLKTDVTAGVSNSYKSFLAIGKTDYGSQTPRQPPVAGCTAPASLPPSASGSGIPEVGRSLKGDGLMSVFAGAVAAPRPVTTPRLSVAGQQRGREERLLHANYRPMQQLAVARRAGQARARARAVLCIVIRESPLSPLSPYLQVPRFATGLFAVLRRASPSLSPSSVFHIPAFRQAATKCVTSQSTDNRLFFGRRAPGVLGAAAKIDSSRLRYFRIRDNVSFSWTLSSATP